MHKIDVFNLILLLLAFVVAYVLPFELLILSYAFLGPLHYLTEISWLHDRKYFTLLPEDPAILTIGSFILLFAGAAIFPTAAELIWLLLLVAFCTAFISSRSTRALLLIGGLLLLWPLVGSVASYAVAVLIPTIIHVYVFTILFMVFGALKSRCALGFTNSILFLLGGIGLLLLPQSNIQLFPSYIAEHYIFFDGIAVVLSQLFAVSTETVLPTIASFLAFAYTSGRCTGVRHLGPRYVLYLFPPVSRLVF